MRGTEGVESRPCSTAITTVRSRFSERHQPRDFVRDKGVALCIRVARWFHLSIVRGGSGC